MLKNKANIALTSHYQNEQFRNQTLQTSYKSKSIFTDPLGKVSNHATEIKMQELFWYLLYNSPIWKSLKAQRWVVSQVACCFLSAAPLMTHFFAHFKGNLCHCHFDNIQASKRLSINLRVRSQRPRPNFPSARHSINTEPWNRPQTLKGRILLIILEDSWIGFEGKHWAKRNLSSLTMQN